jgi:hypothetical protein
MGEKEQHRADRAKPYRGALPLRARRHAPKNVDVGKFGEPPLLENWRLIEDSPVFYPTLYGSVSGHPRLGDRPFVRTSPVIWLSIKLGYARTYSRYYRLGAPAPSDDE